MWDINTFYYDSTSLMKNLAQSCFSGPCPDHVYLSLVVIGAELKEEIYVWHTSHRRTDTVFTHLIEKPAVLTSVSPRAKNLIWFKFDWSLCILGFPQWWFQITNIQSLLQLYHIGNNEIHVRMILRLLLNNHIDGLVLERRNSIADALELRLSCTNPLIYASFLSTNNFIIT